MSRLHIDWTRCDPEVPAPLEEHADHAVRSCPLMALRLV